MDEKNSYTGKLERLLCYSHLSRGENGGEFGGGIPIPVDDMVELADSWWKNETREFCPNCKYYLSCPLVTLNE